MRECKFCGAGCRQLPGEVCQECGAPLVEARRAIVHLETKPIKAAAADVLPARRELEIK